MKRRRAKPVVVNPEDLERRCAAAKAASRRLLSTMERDKAQELASVFPKGCVVKTTDLIGLLESDLEEIKPRGVVRI
jgi:hypothetical protein